MSAYMIVTREGPVRNQAELDIYAQMNRDHPPMVGGLRPIVIYGNIESLEGDAPEGVVVLQFSSIEAAKNWYHSPEYQAALPHRKNGADWRVFIVEGL